VAIAKLFEGFGSVVLEETLAVSVITVPDAVPPITVTTTVNVVEAPTANEGFVHEIEMPVHVQPPVPDVLAAETKVVFAGSASVNASVLAVLGPLFVMTTVYVMLLPASTGLGEATFVIVRLAVFAAPTIVRTVAVLFARFGSFVPDVTDTVSAICVPVTVPPFTCTTTVNVVVPEAPVGTSASVQVITPVPFTAGVAQLQPAAPAPAIAMD
jgi:hypothetical protein